MFLLPRKGRITFEKEARFAKKARLIGNYSVLKTNIFRVGTVVRRLVVMCLYALHNKLQNLEKTG